MGSVTKFLYDVALAGGSGSGGGGGSSDWPVVTVEDDGDVEQTLNKNTVYDFVGSLTSLQLDVQGDPNAHFHFIFMTGATAPTLTMPAGIIMPDSFTVEANKLYEVDIFMGLGAVQSWSAGSGGADTSLV